MHLSAGDLPREGLSDSIKNDLTLGAVQTRSYKGIVPGTITLAPKPS